MALTQISKDGVKADLIDGTKIADDAVGAEHIEVLDANLQLADNVNIQLGTDQDYEIYHNGDHAYLKNTTGNFHIATDGYCAIYGGKDFGTTSAKFIDGASVELYEAGNKKFETTDNGVEITGTTATQKLTATNTYSATDTTQCGYQVQNLSDTTDTYAALRLTAGNTSAATAQIASVRKGTGSNDITFQLEASNTAKEVIRLTSDGYIKYSGTSTADETNKLGRLLMPSHDTNEEDVMYLQMENEATFNQLTIGGGSSSYNSATNIIFRTGDIDTVTGTERMRINSDGIKVTGTIEETDQIVDAWRVTSNFSGDKTPIDADWERTDNSIEGHIIGSTSGMTESSGVFTFPKTGIYRIDFWSESYLNGDDREVRNWIYSTTDNSSYSITSFSATHITQSESSNTHAFNYCSAIVDITNTTDRKVRFHKTCNNSSTTTLGSSDTNRTYVFFTRLGGT